MTSSEAAALALKVHGAVWLAAVAAYYKYGDRIDLFDKALRGNRRLREAVRDNVATDLSKQLQPVIRNATSATSPVLDVDGSYIEHAADITESEQFYQAIRDYVSLSAGSLLDYRLVLETADCWRKWAHRLSRSILVLVILETLMIAGALLVSVTVDRSRIAMPWFLASLALTCIIVVSLLWCLCAVHTKHGMMVDLRERYDPES